MPAPVVVRRGRRPGVVVAAAASAALVLVLAGCSNGESPAQKNPHSGVATATDVGGVQHLTVLTGADFRFHPSTLVVHQGRVSITLKNKAPGNGSGSPPHDLDITGIPGAYAPLISNGRSETITFTAPSPGHYRFVCTIHVQEGMTGTLIVKPGA